MEKYTYLLIDVGAVLVPFIFSFHPRLRFYQQWKFYAPAMLVAAVVFIVWDGMYTQQGVWGFNPTYLTGIYLGNLPLEEILFFLFIPYACVFSYHCFGVLLKKTLLVKTTPWICFALQLLCLAGIIFCYHKLYTVAVCISMLLLIPPVPLRKVPTWMPLFLFTWCVMLLPFFIVNGILTGTGLPEPIVWYNDAENVGIRMLTIPVEDLFYGMSLVLLNVRVYEWLKRTRVNHSTGQTE